MNLEIPSRILIGAFEFNTFGVFLLLGFLLTIFVIWQEGRKDGFDEERLFDLFFVSVVVSLLCARLVYAISSNFVFSALLLQVIRFWTPGLSPSGALVGFLLTTFVLSKRWKWSVFRILDIYSLAFLFGISVVFLGLVAFSKDFRLLFVFAFALLAYAALSVYRKKILSGLIFSSLSFVGTFGYILALNGVDNLIFCGILFTIGLFVLIKRGKVLMPSVANRIDLFQHLKRLLSKKEKKLEKERELIVEEDPYLEEGRDVANSDEIDDAVLEDTQKELTDLRKSSVETTLSLVKKALARMKLGRYGKCDICGGPIEEGRLKAYPEATTCVSCAEKHSV